MLGSYFLYCLNLPGTTTEKECDDISNKYNIAIYRWSNITCNNRNTKATGKAFEKHKFKPCCYGYLGQCLLATPGHCKHLDGIWHSDVRESCAHVHCGQDVCETSHLHFPDDDSQTHFAPVVRNILSFIFHCIEILIVICNNIHYYYSSFFTDHIL